MNKFKLKDISVIRNGATPSTKHKENFGGNISWITPKDLSNFKGKYIYYGGRSITKKGYESCSTKIVPKGTILLSSRAPIGLLAIAGKELCTNQGFKNIVCNNKIVNNEYLYYYLKNNINRLKKIGGGTTFKEISKTDIENFEVQIPSLTIQNKIAHLLKLIDDKIELNNKINLELEQMAKFIYDYWFIQFDFPDENGQPYKCSGGKMIRNKNLNSEIPDKWKSSKLSEFGEFKNGINYDSEINGEKDVKIVNVRDISNSTYIILKENLDDICLLNKDINKYLLNKNDILIARSGIPGATRMIYDNIEGIVYCGFIIRYNVKTDILKNYLFYKLKDIELSMNSKSAGTIMKNISQDTLKDLEIIVPTNDIIEKFNRNINPILKFVYNNSMENEELNKLRDFILPLLMNGQIKFKDAEKLIESVIK